MARVVSLVVTTSDCDVHRDRTNCFIRPACSNKAGAARKEFARSRFDVTIRLLAAIMDQKSSMGTICRPMPSVLAKMRVLYASTYEQWYLCF